MKRFDKQEMFPSIMKMDPEKLRELLKPENVTKMTTQPKVPCCNVCRQRHSHLEVTCPNVKEWLSAQNEKYTNRVIKSD